MKSLWKHILPLLAVVLFASCGKDEAEVIPRGKMSEIYAEMLMTDQWISSTPGMRQIADTSLVYEPILEKYGYDNLDYLKSVEHYMNDPERFSRILRSSAEKLDQRIKVLRKKQRMLELEEEARMKVLKHQTDYSFEEYFPYLADEPYVHYYDSVAFELDSCRVYRLIPIETADTLYDRIEMIVRVDSLAVRDTLTISDTVKLVTPADSLTSPVLDTMPKRIIPVMQEGLSKRLHTDRKIKWQERE